MKLPKFLTTFEEGVTKHSPEILTGIGIAGMISSTILAVRATPKALMLLEEEKKKYHDEKLTPLETVKITWTCYITPAIISTISIVCIIDGQKVSLRRNSVLAAAYSLSESTLREYQSKVIETIGEKKEEAIHDAIAKDKINRDPVVNREVIITGRGETLCYDSISGRYFKSDIEKIRKVEYKLNVRLRSENYISLNDYYYEVGLRGTDMGDDLGWNIENGPIEFKYSSQLDSEDNPCLVISFWLAPKKNYIKNE